VELKLALGKSVSWDNASLNLTKVELKQKHKTTEEFLNPGLNLTKVELKQSILCLRKGE